MYALLHKLTIRPYCSLLRPKLTLLRTKHMLLHALETSASSYQLSNPQFFFIISYYTHTYPLHNDTLQVRQMLHHFPPRNPHHSLVPLSATSVRLCFH